MTDHENIIVERSERVATITLNRPGALNALNEQLMNELVRAAEELDADTGVGCIIVAGSRKAFAAGADISEMQGIDYQHLVTSDWFSGWDRFAAIRTPVVAAVSGYALGGGCELAMMCDVLIASESAKFGQPEITLATIPGIGGSQRLTRAIGKAKAMDLVLTGRTMDVNEAERAGLVARIVPDDDLDATVREVAERIAAMSLPAVYAAKEAVNRAFETTLAEGMKFERRTFMATFALDDRLEGMTAFAEKRPANFLHR